MSQSALGTSSAERDGLKLDQVCRSMWHFNTCSQSLRCAPSSFRLLPISTNLHQTSKLHQSPSLHLTHDIWIHPEAVWARCSPRACSSSGPNCDEASECQMFKWRHDKFNYMFAQCLLNVCSISLNISQTCFDTASDLWPFELQKPEGWLHCLSILYIRIYSDIAWYSHL